MEMQSSDRAQELERLYQARRGHAPQISISDDSHHITEAIGDMYGENEYGRRDSRPLSFISSPTSETFDTSPSYPASPNSLGRTSSNEQHPEYQNGQPPSPNMLSPNKASFDRGAMSPPRLNRQNSDTASQTFEFQDIDSQSSPAAVAQELSNLQAIRRMSMDVHGSDPDLPTFGERVPMPAAAPSHDDDDDDPSRMFWVPARVHPELAPKEFKTFIEEKVQRHRRRSGDSDSSFLSTDGLSREGSTGGLRRKKSMLSKQVEGPTGYRDGAERLERKRSQNGGGAHVPTLSQLESVAEDPATLIRRMSLRDSMDSGVAGVEAPAEDDVPILPVKPSGVLKRSTRTNYRRGSIRKGERVPFNRRMANRHGEVTDTDDSPVSSPNTQDPGDVKWGLQRVQTEPMPPRADPPENFSRPTRLRSPVQAQTQGPNAAKPERPRTAEERPSSQPEPQTQTSPPQQQRKYHSRIASNGRTTALLPGYNVPVDSPIFSSTAAPVPQIVETPPPAETPPPIPAQHPERKSSKVQVDHTASQKHAPVQIPPQPATRLPPGRQSLREKAEKAQANKIPSQSLDEMASHPTAIPGHTSATRSDSLAIIPTFADDKKSDKHDKKSRRGDDDDDDLESGGRKTSWGWFSRKNKEEKEQEEKEKKDKEEKEHKKSKSKLTKSADKSHDNTRLDVLQASIDEGRGRESLVLDRNSIKLDEERQKTSSRKTSNEKKEKEGLFSSIFGGKAKKGEKEAGSKKANSTRGLSPDPPPRVLRPDVDYNWTRFSILEERAIYRMAHIKLANPRRELYSQVLLSNFMYSYLAKVQQMHPHIQIGQSAAQKQQQRQAQEQKKKEEEQRRQQQQQQPEEFQQYQMYQDQQAREERGSEGTTNQYGDAPVTNGSSHASRHQQYNRTDGNGYSVSSGSSYLGQTGAQEQPVYYGQQHYEEDDDGRNDMW